MLSFSGLSGSPPREGRDRPGSSSLGATDFILHFEIFFRISSPATSMSITAIFVEWPQSFTLGAANRNRARLKRGSGGGGASLFFSIHRPTPRLLTPTPRTSHVYRTMASRRGLRRLTHHQQALTRAGIPTLGCATGKLLYATHTVAQG